MKTIVCFDSCATYIDGFSNHHIVLEKDNDDPKLYINNFGSIVNDFVEFASTIMMVQDTLKDSDEDFIFHTDLLDTIKEYCDGTADKVVHSWLSHCWKTVKMMGLDRPNRFIIIDKSEDENGGAIEKYVTSQLFESQDGDNIYTHLNNPTEEEIESSIIENLKKYGYM